MAIDTTAIKEITLEEQGTLATPQQHEYDEFWLSKDHNFLDRFIIFYRQASFSFNNNSANWINAQLQPIETAIMECQEKMAALYRDEQQYATISQRVAIPQKEVGQCRKDFQHLQRQLKDLEVKKREAFVANNKEEQDRIFHEVLILRRKQTVLQHYLQYHENKEKMESSRLRLKEMLPQDPQYKQVTEELKIHRQEFIASKIMVELDLVEYEIANLGQDQVQRLERLRQTEAILKKELSYHKLDKERLSKLRERVPLQKALELMDESALSLKDARQHFSALMCEELKLSETAVLGLCYTLQPFLTEHHSRFAEGAIISEPKMIVKREGDSIIATLYTDATTPNGDKQSFCSQFKVDVEDLTYGNKGGFKKAPVRSVTTYPVVADLKTLFSLWRKIDLDNEDEVNQFKREILNPYLKKQIECREEYKHTADKLPELLLAIAKTEGLDKIEPVLMQIIHKTSGYMAVSTMSLQHGRKDRPKLQGLFYTALMTPDEAAVSMEDLIAKTKGMNKAELEEFELFLERFAVEFDQDVNMLRDQVSTLDEQKKSVGGLDGFQKQCRQHEAAVRAQYKPLFQLRCQFGVEGVAAAQQKRAEVERAISVTQNDPVHKRYEILIQRQKPLMDERELLIKQRGALDANKSHAAKKPGASRIGGLIAAKLGDIVESIFKFRAKETQRLKDATESRLRDVEERLKPIDTEIESIKRYEAVTNPYIAYTDEQLREISGNLETLCRIETEIEQKKPQRKIAVESDAKASPSETSVSLPGQTKDKEIKVDAVVSESLAEIQAPPIEKKKGADEAKATVAVVLPEESAVSGAVQWRSAVPSSKGGRLGHILGGVSRFFAPENLAANLAPSVELSSELVPEEGDKVTVKHPSKVQRGVIGRTSHLPDPLNIRRMRF